MTTLDTAFDKALTEEQGKQSTLDQAPEPTKEAEVAAKVETPVEEKVTEHAQPPEGSEQLLDQETYDKLKANPEELRKALNKAFTQKTQELSEQRKQMGPYLELAKSLENDPKGTIQELAKRFGVTATEEKTVHATEQIVDKVSAILQKTLGPEAGELVTALSTAIREAATEASQSLILKEVEPLKQQAMEERERTVTENVKQNLEAFGKDHPDWKQYEPKMVELSNKFQPSKDPTTGEYPTWKEYMESLYVLATAGAKKADIVKEAIKRMDESARKAETSDSGVATSHVVKSAPKYGNFNEAFKGAFEDAKAGVIYEK